MKKPTIFIGSSSEGIHVAESIQILLSTSNFETLLWNQGIFGLSKALLEELINLLKKSDFGIFIFRNDDVLISRNESYNFTRDNVIFELGLSFGILGQDKTFIVYDKSQLPKIIEDLKGIIYTTYDGSLSDLNISLGPAVSRIKQEINKHLKPDEILYTEWHLGTKVYIEYLNLYFDSSNHLQGYRKYIEEGGNTQFFEVSGYRGRGFVWLQYNRQDGKGGGTVMLHDVGTGNFDGLITAGHCDTSILRCYKNRWVLLSEGESKIEYKNEWLKKIGEY